MARGYWQGQEEINGPETTTPQGVAQGGHSQRYVKPKRIDFAITAAQKSLSIVSADAPTLTNSKVLYLAQAGVRKVAEAHREQVPSSSNNSKADKEYALKLVKTGKFKEAIETLRTLKNSWPLDTSIRVALIEAYFKAGMKSDGERETQELLDFSTLPPTEGLTLAKALIDNKQLQTAQKLLKNGYPRPTGLR
jgi:predicted Zn-dependent protease